MPAIIGVIVVCIVGVALILLLGREGFASFASHRDSSRLSKRVSELERENLILHQKLAAVGGYLLATTWQSNNEEVRTAAIASLRDLNRLTEGVVSLEIPMD